MKNEKLKIVTIGGGSSYTPELCEGLIRRYKNFPVSEWILVDIQEGKKHNEIIFALVKRMFKKANIKIKIKTAYSLTKSVLSGADFVTTQIRVGGLKARKEDEKIPFKYGILGQETNGLGGQFKAMRTVPIIKDIVSKVKKYANGAWIINFSNPAGMITEYINKYEDYKNFIGLCNVPIHTVMGMAKIAETSYENLTTDAAGLNHYVFFNKFYKNGKDITKELIRKTEDEKSSKILTVKNIADLKWNPVFVKGIESWPCSYHKYYFKRGTMLKKGINNYKKNGSRAEQVIKIEKDLFEKYNNKDLDHKPKELEKRGGAYYSDVACGVMKAIYANTDEEFVVNTLNDGKVKNLPKKWIVEVTCKIGKDGPKKVDREIIINRKILSLVEVMKNYEFLVLESIKKRDILIGKTAAMINPLSEDDTRTEMAFNELFLKHKKFLKSYK